MSKKILISFSGGETSGYMLKFLLEKYANDSSVELLTVFANTGDEREETLQFVDMCDKHFNANVVWVECVTNPNKGDGVTAKVVDYNTASRNAEPFKAMVAKFGIPNQKFPHCSRELKGRTIKAFARSVGWKKYETAIGIRFDEPKRLDWEKAKRERLIYPLASDILIKKPMVNQFWREMPFRLNLKSYEGNCKVCWKKSLRKLMTIAVENPKAFQAFQEIEMEYGYFLPDESKKNSVTLPIRFFRGNMTVEDIFEEARFPFEKARDEKFDYSYQSDLWSEFMDSNAGCVESCEAF